MTRRPHSNYDPQHFLSIGYDTTLLHVVSPALAALSYAEVRALVDSLPWTVKSGNRKRRGARVARKPDGIAIWVSLPRALRGTNAALVGPRDVVDALVRVAEALGVALAVVLHARVYRLDVAANLPLALRPSEYARRLVHVPRAALHPYSPTSRAFVNGTRELAFYDKATELRETGRPVPAPFAGLNVLRYELRMLKGLTRVFGQPVRAEDLASPDLYSQAVEEWVRWFGSVETSAVPEFGVPRTVHELMRALAAGYVADHGAADVVAALDAHCADGLISPDQRGRQRRRVLGLASGPVTDGAPMAELRAAVRAAADRSLSVLC